MREEQLKNRKIFIGKKLDELKENLKSLSAEESLLKEKIEKYSKMIEEAKAIQATDTIEKLTKQKEEDQKKLEEVTNIVNSTQREIDRLSLELFSYVIPVPSRNYCINPDGMEIQFWNISYKEFIKKSYAITSANFYDFAKRIIGSAKRLNTISIEDLQNLKELLENTDISKCIDLRNALQKHNFTEEEIDRCSRLFLVEKGEDWGVYFNSKKADLILSIEYMIFAKQFYEENSYRHLLDFNFEEYKTKNHQKIIDYKNGKDDREKRINDLKNTIDRMEKVIATAEDLKISHKDLEEKNKHLAGLADIFMEIDNKYNKHYYKLNDQRKDIESRIAVIDSILNIKIDDIVSKKGLFGAIKKINIISNIYSIDEVLNTKYNQITINQYYYGDLLPKKHKVRPVDIEVDIKTFEKYRKKLEKEKEFYNQCLQINTQKRENILKYITKKLQPYFPDFKITNVDDWFNELVEYIESKCEKKYCVVESEAFYLKYTLTDEYKYFSTINNDDTRDKLNFGNPIDIDNDSELEKVIKKATELKEQSERELTKLLASDEKAEWLDIKYMFDGLKDTLDIIAYPEEGFILQKK